MGTSRRIAGPACLAALEAARLDIFSSVKQRTEEGDFGLGGRTLIHANLLQRGQSDKRLHKHILHLDPRKAPSTIESRRRASPTRSSSVQISFPAPIGRIPQVRFEVLWRLPDSELYVLGKHKSAARRRMLHLTWGPDSVTEASPKEPRSRPWSSRRCKATREVFSGALSLWSRETAPNGLAFPIETSPRRTPR